MTTIDFRLFDQSEPDFQAFTHIHNTIWPDYVTLEGEFRHKFANDDPREQKERFMLLLDGEIVGYGIIDRPPWIGETGEYQIAANVLPAHRRHGVAGAFFEFAQARVEDPITKIYSYTREDYADSVSFLAKRGFRKVMRYPISRLNVAEFDPADFQSAVDRAATAGIRIVSLADYMDENEAWRMALWQLAEHEISRDIPSPEPYRPRDFDVYVRQSLERPTFEPQAIFLALDNATPVGLTSLQPSSGDPTKYETYLTGTLRTHRRLGIATALKVQAIAYARSHGAKTIETDNEENNPMYAINMKLGFEPQPAWVDYAKVLDFGDYPYLLELWKEPQLFDNLKVGNKQ